MAKEGRTEEPVRHHLDFINPDFYLSILAKISQIFVHQIFFDQLSNNNPVHGNILRFYMNMQKVKEGRELVFSQAEVNI